MDLPHHGHLARVLAVVTLILLAIGGWARSGAFPDDGRRLLVIGAIVGLLVSALAFAGARS